MKHSYIIRCTIILLISLYIKECIHHQNDKKQLFCNDIETNLDIESTNADVWLTIFVHGTIVLHPRFLIENIAALKHDKVDDTLYGHVIKDARSISFFFQSQAIQEPGLKKINESLIKRGYTSGALAYTIQRLQCFMSLDNQTRNHYYTFGWSGLISNSSRKEAAHKLYIQLDNQIREYKQRGINPKIRLIGYSHGGNVCLNMAHYACNNDWHVDELILLGVPVQPATDYLIADPLFKKSYHIYSREDHVQQHDFFSFGFSRQYFKPHGEFELPDNLTQIKLRVAKTVSCEYPIIARQHSFIYHRPLSPGHIELWFFGWTPNYYRKRYPFYPLPTIAFIPYVIHQIQQNVTGHDPERPLVVTLAPEQEIMSIAMNKKDKCPLIVPFVPMETLDELTELMLTDYKPHNYRERFYKKRDCIIREAIKKHMKKRPTSPDNYCQ